MAKIRTSRPLIEHHNTAVVHTGTSQPRLSWKFEADDTLKGWHQTHYTFKISAWGQPHHELSTQSSDSVLIPWPGDPLSSWRPTCRVKVRVDGVDEDGNAANSLWSEETVVNFVPPQSSLSAQFIGSSLLQPTDGPLRPLRFRNVFELPEFEGVIDKAKLYITAYGVYKVFINGQRVGDEEMAPGWTSYSHRHLYQTHDPGRNVIGVEVAEGWYAGRLGWAQQRHFYGKELGVYAQLDMEAAESAVTVVTDNTWKCDYGPLLSSEIYDGEVYDARSEQLGWSEAGSDDPDSDWRSTRVLPPTSGELVPSELPPVKVAERIKPTRIFESVSGKTIVDFGQNLVGKLLIKRLQQPLDHRIIFRHAEVMEDGELGVEPLRSAAATDTIISNGALIENWSPQHTFHGFRYVEVEGWSPSDIQHPLSIDSIEALVMHTDMKRTGWFSCSDPLINRLHENTVWSMRGNFLSIPTDCPQRDERLGWTGDIQVFGPSANFLFDTSAMLGSWLDDVSSEQATHDGIPPFVVPNILASDKGDNSWGNFPQAVWDDVVILLPWALYRSFGDLEILRRQYPSMQMWIDRGVRRGADDLWDSSFHQLGDWLDPSAPPDRPGEAKTDGTFVADAYLLHVTRLMIEISEVLGHKGEAARYTVDFKRLKKVFSRKYITIDGLLVADTQTGLALAIVFDLFKTPDQAKVAASRLERAVKLANFKVATGFTGTPIITHALSSVGLQNLAYRMLFEKECPSWLYPITMGATTIWERWNSMLPDGSINPGEMTSFNHYALGSIVNWLHEVVGGISPLEPGWKRSLIRPVPGGSLTHAEVKHDTPYGLLSCNWRMTDGVFTLSIVVPPNTSAKVVMPDKQTSKILGEAEENGVVVGSGHYEFSCKHETEKMKPKAIPIPFYSPVKEESWL
ncbi:glycoside hydrolase family 78 protein [Aureobasidium subglaciale]|nr:glycoside hydrolase family 78 protein [Aureobasidium subglaciale]